MAATMAVSVGVATPDMRPPTMSAVMAIAQNALKNDATSSRTPFHSWRGKLRRTEMM